MALNQADLVENHEDTEKDRYLTFMLGDEAFGIEIRYVIEIIGMYPITRLPEVPTYIKGLINLRSKIIPVVDVRLKFDKPSVPYDDRTCIVVVDVNEMQVGLIVDMVSEVAIIPAEMIVAPPESSVSKQNDFLCGIATMNGEVKLLLDCEKLLQEEMIDSES